MGASAVNADLSQAWGLGSCVPSLFLALEKPSDRGGLAAAAVEEQVRRAKCAWAWDQGGAAAPGLPRNPQGTGEERIKTQGARRKEKGGVDDNEKEAESAGRRNEQRGLRRQGAGAEGGGKG